MYIYTYVWRACVGTRAGQRVRHIYSSSALHLILETGFLAEPRAHHIGHLANKPPVSSRPHLAPSTTVTEICCQTLFTWVLRIHDYTVNTLPTWAFLPAPNQHVLLICSWVPNLTEESQREETNSSHQVCAGWLYVNLAQDKVVWKKGTSIKEMPP